MQIEEEVFVDNAKNNLTVALGFRSIPQRGRNV